MAPCIVHLGMHKTGSTSIQQSLQRHLQDPAFRFVDLGVANASRPVATAFRRNPEHYHRNARLGLRRSQLGLDAERTRLALATQLREAGERTTIISGEDIAELSESELSEFFAFVAAEAGAVRAVAYVRAPQEFMASMFQQRLKGGARELHPARLFPRYRARLAGVVQLLGRDNVHFWRFAPDQFEHRCVVRDFCARLSIDFDPRCVIRRNTSLSLPAIQLLYAYRRFGPARDTGAGSGEENRRMIGRLRVLRGPSLQFHSSLVAPLLEKHQKTLAWMNAQLDSPFPAALPADTECAVASENDLLAFSARSLEWLADQPAVRTAGWRSSADPAAVALAVHQLRIATDA